MDAGRGGGVWSPLLLSAEAAAPRGALSLGTGRALPCSRAAGDPTHEPTSSLLCHMPPAAERRCDRCVLVPFISIITPG